MVWNQKQGKSLREKFSDEYRHVFIMVHDNGEYGSSRDLEVLKKVYLGKQSAESYLKGMGYALKDNTYQPVRYYSQAGYDFYTIIKVELEYWKQVRRQ